MKKFLLMLLTMMSLTSFAQIHVKEDSFRKIEGFVMFDKALHTDDNNVPMALIKISTENITAAERRKITFKGNLATYFDVQIEPSEIYLYLSTTATFLEIHHPDYGKTEYWLPENLCDFCGYEMVVVSDFHLDVDNAPKVNYVSINADNADAMIFIDDEFVGIKNVSKLLGVDETHTWRIECDMYETEMGEFVVGDGEPVVIDKQLTPVHGSLSINTTPEDSASVYLDGRFVGLTPFFADKIRTGEHKVIIYKEAYKSCARDFELSSGDTAYMDVAMPLDAAEVVVLADASSQIYVDNVMKGLGEWSGKVSLGTHLFEARKTGYRASFRVADIEDYACDTIVLPIPTPIYGYLNISSTPTGAAIYIDGTYQGVTPRVVKDILIGEHELKLEKEGYAVLFEEVSVVENLTSDLNEVLHKGKDITIETDLPGDKLFVDKYYIGESPQTLNLKYGLHTISVERDGYKIDEKFDVSVNGDSMAKIIFGKNVRIETDRRDHIYIDGVRLGVSPCETVLSYGEHELLIKRGNRTVEEKIVVEKNDDEAVFKYNLGREIVVKTMVNGDVVYVDDKRVGLTPAKVYMYFGEHDIKVVSKHGDKQTYGKINVENDGPDEYTLYYGQLVKLESKESGDEVYLDDKKIGITPMEYDFDYGYHKVVVKNRNKVEERDLYISKDSETTYMFDPVKETIDEFNNNGIKYFSLNMSYKFDGNMSYGFTFGRYKKCGWYVSLMSNIDAKNDMIYTGLTQFFPNYTGCDDIKGAYEYTDGLMTYSQLSAVAGVMFRIKGPVYLKLGGGLGKYSTYNELDNGEIYKMTSSSYGGLLMSAGLQFNVKNFVFSSEMVASPDFKSMELKLGLGLGWKK